VNKRSEAIGITENVPAVFLPEKAGESLRKVSVDLLEIEEQKISSYWYHGEEGIDLFIWKDQKGNIIKQQLSYVGQIIEWNLLEGLKTGVIVEEELDGAAAKASEQIIFDDSPQKNAVSIAVAVLQHITCVDEAEKNLIVQNMTEQRSLKEMSLREVLERYEIESVNTRWYHRLRDRFILFLSKIIS
jgi:hypothetical protein